MKGRGQELIYDCKYSGGNLGGKHEIRSWMILWRSEDSGVEAAQRARRIQLTASPVVEGVWEENSHYLRRLENKQCL